MTLNIKSAKTHRLAKELACLTGESVPVAVAKAIHERLDRVRSREGMAERIMQIAKECAAHWKEPYKSMDIDELLYDKNGLPK